jgi:hypothetical protein
MRLCRHGSLYAPLAHHCYWRPGSSRCRAAPDPIQPVNPCRPSSPNSLAAKRKRTMSNHRSTTTNSSSSTRKTWPSREWVARTKTCCRSSASTSSTPQDSRNSSMRNWAATRSAATAWNTSSIHRAFPAAMSRVGDAPHTSSSSWSTISSTMPRFVSTPSTAATI